MYNTMPLELLYIVTLFLSCASPARTAAIDSSLQPRATNPYAPVKVKCPIGTPLTRSSTGGISDNEASWIQQRKTTATAALQEFLRNTGEDFPVLADEDYPTLGLTTSGGGFRSFLTGLGLHQAWDNREPNNDASTSGLYQAMSYEAGISGGSWLVSSLAGNDHPILSQYQANFFEARLANSALSSTSKQTPARWAQIQKDVAAKKAAGFVVSSNDPYGRMVGYNVLTGANGGWGKLFSGVTGTPSFVQHTASFPIITSILTDPSSGDCRGTTGMQMEFSPYEFGSWDSSIAGFTPTKYLGTSMSNGQPTDPNTCTTRFDSHAIIHASSSNIYTKNVCTVPINPKFFNPSFGTQTSLLPSSGANQTVTNSGTTDQISTQDLGYALFPNPFHNLPTSPAVADKLLLRLADGGNSNQPNPIWPFLYRDVDVLFVNDNSIETSVPLPDGSDLRNTYDAAQAAGTGNRMPSIPDAATFAAEGLANKPTVFGCDGDKGTLTIVYITNRPYVYNSYQSTVKMQYTRAETRGMVANGKAVGTYNGTEGFGTCMGCVAMKKGAEASEATLPDVCQSCFDQYCYN